MQLVATQRLAVSFNASVGTYAVTDRSTGAALLSGAGLMCDATSIKLGTVPCVSNSTTEDAILGHSSRALLELPGADGLNLLWEVAVYEDPPILLLRLGLHHTGVSSVRVREISPCNRGLALTGLVTAPSQVSTLDGQAGAGQNRVLSGPERESPNNLLIYLRSPVSERAIVAGGLTYRDFAKYIAAANDVANQGVRLTLREQDPVGRLVQPGERYLAEDWFFLDLLGVCPFATLERYASWVRRANRASPCPYFFPTVCAWHASMPDFGDGEWINHTSGLVEELNAAEKVGFMHYSALGVQLVPNTCEGTATLHKDARAFGPDSGRLSEDRNTEQGWWDDDHWQLYSHYTTPYETSEKWASAVKARGGIPITYVQTGHVSCDYATAFPGHMLGNDISRLDAISVPPQSLVVYDYTDLGFRAHLREVWSRLGRAGVQGVLFDNPEQGWVEGQGFEDKVVTTTAAYRGIFDLVRPALGPVAFVQEHNPQSKAPYLDVTVGIVDSQRVSQGTDGVSADMYRMCALRWYKTRTLYAYDTDAKNLLKIAERGRDFLRQVLTMLYLISARLLLANSIRVLPADVLFDLSRLFPAHREPITPRPLDAFMGVEIPRIYCMSLREDWHQIALLNRDPVRVDDFAIPLDGRHVDGALAMPAGSEWHIWDFWNDCPVGVLRGSDILQQTLRPSEARMLSLRRRQEHPQVVSSNRHLLQGWVELSEVIWDPAKRVLTGTLAAVAGEGTYITIASNGATVRSVNVENGVGSVFALPGSASDYVRVVILTQSDGPIRWTVNFQ